jgi:hypothetical protein
MFNFAFCGYICSVAVFPSPGFHQDTTSEVRSYSCQVFFLYIQTLNQALKIHINKKQICKCRLCNVQLMILQCLF